MSTRPTGREGTHGPGRTPPQSRESAMRIIGVSVPVLTEGRRGFGVRARGAAESEDDVVKRTAVLWALNAMACSAIQASAPASKPSSASSTDLPPAAAALTPYATVTDERLQHPEAGDWLMYRRTYDGSGFSPLSQINAKNSSQSLSGSQVRSHSWIKRTAE